MFTGYFELLALEKSSQGMKLTTYLNLVLRLRICGHFCPFMYSYGMHRDNCTYAL
jgi:hypothetical protein